MTKKQPRPLPNDPVVFTCDEGTFTLTLAPEAAQEVAYNAGGGSGQGDLIQGLSKLALARAERGEFIRGMDHVHLSRFYKTDYVQWYGRCADGWHRPVGRIMQIIGVKHVRGLVQRHGKKPVKRAAADQLPAA